jgi:hypothetical protein
MCKFIHIMAIEAARACQFGYSIYLRVNRLSAFLIHGGGTRLT